MISETGIVDWAMRDERAAYGKHRANEIVAASYGDDVRKMIAFELNGDAIRLQARCAFRFARLALDEA